MLALFFHIVLINLHPDCEEPQTTRFEGSSVTLGVVYTLGIYALRVCSSRATDLGSGSVLTLRPGSHNKTRVPGVRPRPMGACGAL